MFYVGGWIWDCFDEFTGIFDAQFYIAYAESGNKPGNKP